MKLDVVRQSVSPSLAQFVTCPEKPFATPKFVPERTLFVGGRLIFPLTPARVCPDNILLAAPETSAALKAVVVMQFS